MAEKEYAEKEYVLDCRFHDKDASGSALLETNLSGSRWRGEM